MPHTTCASTLQQLENELAEIGFTITTADNPAPAAANDKTTPQITNAPRRVQGDLTVGKASARVFISGWDDADGLVLVRTRAGIDTIRTDDTPTVLVAVACQVADLVRRDGNHQATIEIHPGADGRLYLHDPADHTRFGPADSYNTREAARLMAAVTDPDATIIDR